MKICKKENRVFFNGMAIGTGVDVKIKSGKTEKWFMVCSSVDDFNFFRVWDKKSEKHKEIRTSDILDIRVQQ